MKYHKFEKIRKGENPIIRITYKNWWGKTLIKDVIKYSDTGLWVFMESNELTYKFRAINNFYESEEDVYFVNGK